MWCQCQKASPLLVFPDCVIVFACAQVLYQPSVSVFDDLGIRLNNRLSLSLKRGMKKKEGESQRDLQTESQPVGSPADKSLHSCHAHLVHTEES